jgi:preprotein translocase subunit SecA
LEKLPADSAFAMKLNQTADAIAERAFTCTSDSISDAALIHRLADSACLLFTESPAEDSVVQALSIAAVAVRRRMGIWRAVLDDPSELSGPVRDVRLLADRLLDPTDPGAPIHSISRHDTLADWATLASRRSDLGDEASAALRWLLIARLRTRAEHPPHIHFSPGFYLALRELDDDDCLLYAPTKQQIAAATLLLDGAIVEMDAGEGKTLASAIAAIIFAAAGRRVHILTANDYLAARDCDALAFTMESLGLTPGLVTASMDPDERRLQYPYSIVFATAREVGFDYLRDNIARLAQARVSPLFDVAIVDEADHLLIDQARTPLIIAGEAMPEYEDDDAPENLAIRIIEEQAARVDILYSRLDEPRHADESTDRTLATILLAEGLTPKLVSTLERLGKTSRQIRLALLTLNDDDEDNPLESDLLFTIDATNSALGITALGWDFIADRLDSPAAAFEVAQILRARVIHDSGEDYVVDPEGVTLVDRLDGRPMPSHRYVDGLHEAIEDKEGVEERAYANPVARTTIHALMSNYATVAGLTGTAIEAADIFAQDYGAAAVRVPPTFPTRRIDLDTRVYFDRSEHTLAVSDQVAHWHRVGRPVLVTFGSVRESADFSDVLASRGIAHRLLNASNPFSESEIVEHAGEFGTVTVSTGMAGRGTDIIVSEDVDRAIEESLGQPTDRVEAALGLLVIIASLPASRRVERQIRGRAARQGRPGTSAMAIYINDPVLAFTRQQTYLFKMKNPSDAYVEGVRVQELLEQVQREAESRHRAIMRATAEFATVIERESRTHYSFRKTIMDDRGCRRILVNDVARWVNRKTEPLRDIRSNYRINFDSIAESLWDEYEIDIGSADLNSPAQAKDALTLLVEDRLFRHRTRLGDRRFALSVSDLYLDALDGLWPDHLAALQDIALSIAISAESHAAALIQFAEEALAARSKLRTEVAEAVISSLLNSEYIEPTADSSENRTERLPSELSDLIT